LPNPHTIAIIFLHSLREYNSVEKEIDEIIMEVLEDRAPNTQNRNETHIYSSYRLFQYAAATGTEKRISKENNSRTRAILKDTN
jgi:hypothetical protein